MKMLKSMIAVALMMLCSSTYAQKTFEQEATEQGYYTYPYHFLQLQGGISTVFTNMPACDLLKPTVTIGYGYFFTPVIGVRVNANGWQSKSGFGDTHTCYQYKYINGNADLLVNMTNLIFPKRSCKWLNFNLVGGVGVNYAWGNNDFNALTYNNPLVTNDDISNAWGESKTRNSLISGNVRLGAIVDFAISKHWNVGAEVDFNNLSDQFNSKYSGKRDWMMTAQVSLTYKFGHKKYVAPEPEPIVVPEPEPEPEPIVVPEPEPEPAPVEVKLAEFDGQIFFNINKTVPTVAEQAKIKLVADFLKSHPKNFCEIYGYADVKTGNARINQKLSEGRLDYVIEALKKEGVAFDQIKKVAYGDTVQPFAENEKNRVVTIKIMELK